MKARIDYCKLMLYHNLVNSDDRRIAKQLIEEQKKMDRDGTWYSGIQKIMLEYEIEDTAIEELKSSWKKKVKGKIYEKTEEYLRENCKDKSKCRTVLLEEYEPKEYLYNVSLKEAKKILKSRLHMVKFPCNYRGSDANELCWFCGAEDIKTEHYFKCKGTQLLQNIWSVNESDLSSKNTNQLSKTSRFLELVEEKFKPKWSITRETN